jgi:toxin HigB-1
MITTFRHKGLEELFRLGRTKRIDKKMHTRLLKRLDLMNQISHPTFFPTAWDFHPTHAGSQEYQIDVSGPWRLFFYFREGGFYDVDFDQRH